MNNDTKLDVFDVDELFERVMVYAVFGSPSTGKMTAKELMFVLGHIFPDAVLERWQEKHEQDTSN